MNPFAQKISKIILFAALPLALLAGVFALLGLNSAQAADVKIWDTEVKENSTW